MIPLSSRERISVMAVLSAMALAVLSAGAVNLALPQIGHEFGASAGEAVLVVTVYQMAIVIGLLPIAHVADALGHRRLFSGGVALFAAASIACALAPNLPWLIVARFVQGLGSAAIMALGIALLALSLGRERLGPAIAWNALTAALCSAAGPALGAVILSLGNWPWLFLADVPVALIALTAARGLPEVSRSGRNVDASSVALYVSAIASLAFAALGAFSSIAATVVLSILALICFGSLARRERSRDRPLVPFDLLALPTFRRSMAASICCFAGQAAGLVVLPFYLQSILKHGPLTAGLVIACWPLTVAMSSVVASRVLRGIDPAKQCAAGGALLAAGLLLAAFAPAESSLVPLGVGVSLCGAGFGLFQLANNRSLFLSAPAARAAAAGGLQGTARLTGQTIGTLVVSLAFARSSFWSATQVGLLLGAGCAMLGVTISLLAVFALPQRLAPRTLLGITPEALERKGRAP